MQHIKIGFLSIFFFYTNILSNWIGSLVRRWSLINAQGINDSEASSFASHRPPRVLVSMSSFLGELLENLQSANIPRMRIAVPPGVSQMVSQFIATTQPGTSVASQQTPTQAKMHSPQISYQTSPELPSVTLPAQRTLEHHQWHFQLRRAKGKQRQ